MGMLSRRTTKASDFFIRSFFYGEEVVNEIPEVITFNNIQTVKNARH
jgi:hypothetical protein